jgi:type VI secretion system secreted protein VgrG
MRLTTDLGDTLRFQSMRATEELGRPFEFDVEAVAEDDAIAPQDLLGKTACVALQRADGSDRHFHGLVSAMGVEGGADAGWFRYRLVLRPALWLATRRADTRIFQTLAVTDILKQVLAPFGVDVNMQQLNGDYPPYDYCVQYRETDFNFASRLMEQEGIYYYFEHAEDGHTMVLVDSPGAHAPCPSLDKFVYRESVDTLLDLEPVTEWRARHQVQPAQVVLTDYDFAAPATPLEASASAGRKGALPKLEIYDYPCDYPTQAEGARYAEVRMQELDAGAVRAAGAGLMRTLACGYRFALDEHPQARQNGEYLVVSSRIDMSATAYRSGEGRNAFACRFTAIGGSEIFRPERSTPRPTVSGPQTAVVVGPAGDEIFTDEHGRVKVQFHWDRLGKKDENSSCWIRVSQPWAGQGWGAVSIPRIGQEVIVDFLEGNPDRPIITGRVYNASQAAPFALPGAAATSGIKSQTHKGKGFNEMSMDDTAGQEKVTVHAQFDMGTTVEHDDTQTVHNDRTIKVDGKHTETVTKDTKIVIETGTYSHDVAANTATYHVKGDLTENFDAKHTQTVGADQSITLKAKRSTDITADDKLTVGGKRDENVTGNRTTQITADESLTVNGKQTTDVTGEISISSKAKITLNVMASTVEIAPGGITLTCGPSTVKIDPSGVSITAPKISLNG